MPISFKPAALFLLLLILQGVSPLLHAHPEGACGSFGVHEHLQDNCVQDGREPAQISATTNRAANDCVATISMHSGVKPAHLLSDQDPPAALLDSALPLTSTSRFFVQTKPPFFQAIPPPRPNSRAPPSQPV